MAISEASRLAKNLKGLHLAELRKAVDEHRSMADTDKLCREMELLSKEHNALPHQIASENVQACAGVHLPSHACNTLREAENAQTPAAPGRRDGSLQASVRFSTSEDNLGAADGNSEPPEPPLVEPPMLPKRSLELTGTHSMASRASQAVGGLAALSVPSTLLVREQWLEGKGDLTKACEDKLAFTISPKRDYKRNLSFGDLLRETRPTDCQCSCTFHPVGGVRIVWNVLCLIAILYDLFFIPLQAFDLGESTVLDVCEWMLTWLWTFDLFLTFRTGYFIGSTVEMRQTQIAVHYAKTWLVVDIIIVLLEWMGRFFDVTSSASLLRSTRASRNILGVVKLLRLTKMKKLWIVIFEQFNSNVFELIWTLLCVCLSMMALVHFMSCVWYAMGNSRNDGWPSYEAYEGRKDVFFWYIASARWVISQMNGRTDMNPDRNMVERLFTCVIGIILAVILQALFVSTITKTMIGLSDLVSEQTRRRRLVNDYLQVHPLPPTLRSQVKRCLFEYQDSGGLTEKEEAVLSVLPSFLQTSVLYEVRAPVIVKNAFFFTLSYESPWSMRLVCHEVMSLVAVAKSEVLFDKGDACTRILFMDQMTATYGNPDVVGAAAEYQMESSKSNESAVPNSSTVLGSDVASSRISTTTSVYEFSRSVEKDFCTIAAGDWVSEPSLWTIWTNQGRLVADAHGVMLGACVDDLVSALTKHRDAFAMAAMYAEKFVEHLRLQEQLSDVVEFEVLTHAPASLHVEVVSAKGIAPQRLGSLFETMSEVYCVCKVTGLTGSHGEIRFTTPGVSDFCNPVWSYDSNFELYRHQSLVFQVWSDKLIGEVQIDPEDIFPIGFSGERQLSSGNGLLTIKIEVEDVNGHEVIRSLN